MESWPLQHSLFIHILFYLVNAGQNSKVIVNTKSGPIQGFKYLSGNSEIAVFRGIPFAEAPVGVRRFNPPIPISRWKDVFTASKYGDVCIQKSSTYNQTYIGEEDCLTLNIFKPMLFKKENKNIPVIVMIHTGNFISGSGKDINGVELSKTLEAIIVTLNYRLGIFGFYSMNGHIKENLGILDQITALKWIKNSIDDFSGNSNNILLIADQITAFVHLMSPLSRILFNRAISYDGKSYLGPVKGYNFNFYKHRAAIEQLCGKIATNTHLPVEHIVWVCLRQKSSAELVHLSNNLFDNVLWHPFRPVYDNHVISYNSHVHSSFLHCDYMAFKSSVPFLPSPDLYENTTSCKDIFQHAISEITILYNDNTKFIQDILQSNYFPPFLNNSYDYCQAITSLLNDFMTSEIISFTNQHSRTGLTFVNLVNAGSPGYITTTWYEFIQNTNVACLLTNQNAGSCVLSEHISTGINSIVRTFLYHGYPTVSSDTIWRPYTTTSKNYLQTDNNFATGDSANWPLERLERLWIDLIPDVGNVKPPNSEAEIKVVEQSVGLSWGMTEQQLEALIFSLILSCLVLLCVTLTLFRIVCFVNGKTFYSKEKKKKTKDIVLTKSKKRTDQVPSLTREIFHTNDSVHLNRRIGDSIDIEA